MAKMERVEEGDPLQCQSIFAHGQCPYKRVEHSEYCQMHGGNNAQQAHRKKSIHDYRLQLVDWQNRVDELAGSSHIKSLRGEIGILRMVMESVINQIKTPIQFPIFADKIQSVARDLKGLVETCQKIEERNKELLSKTEVFNIADAVVNVISNYIKDPDDLLAAGEELYAVIVGIASGENQIRNQSQVSDGRKPMGVQIPYDEPSVSGPVEL
jgi:hypothetical protein